ncbi:MAG TPA: hypothetical protein VMZ92_10675 [Planctomycetota bacterium]|nr:hypothetical protein [Planctomycetota bacterium]
MTPLLLISSTIALALLVVHSWRTRGRFATLAFFISATLFGILRGNVIWLLMKYLSGDAFHGLKPYVPQGALIPPIGHASLQVAVGWVFALYLAWTVSERILRRLPRFAGRVFMIGGLASLFMLAICWCMETTAVSVGWWHWTLPTRSTLFGTVNVDAMEGWFSVVPDFLIPFLVIACAQTKHRTLKWLWLMAFPLHMLGHSAYKGFTHAYLVYPAMELVVVALMMFSGLRLARGEMREPSGEDRVSGPLLASALVIFFGVIVTANALNGEAWKALTILPMLILSLLAWRRLPARWVLASSLASLVGWVWMGPWALWALVPVAAFGFLKLLERLKEPLWLRLAVPVAVVALTVVSMSLREADKQRTTRYIELWMQGDRLALTGSSDDAAAVYEHADRSRPRDLLRDYQAIRRMMQIESKSPVQGARILKHRLPRIVRELEELVRRDPEGVPPREDLVYYYLLLGRVSDATDQYRAIHRLRRHDADIMAMLAYLLLREGKTREAEELCTRALRLAQPPTEAMINLGVVRFSQGRDDDAHRLWERALEREPEQVLALLNLARPKAGPTRRGVDMRYLARGGPGRHLAPQVCNLAAAGSDYTTDERIRLAAEAAQLDPTLLEAQVNLMHFYLRGGPLGKPDRALWHARRAVTLVLESRQPAQVARVRSALEQARKSLPPARVPELQELLDMLRS